MKISDKQLISLEKISFVISFILILIFFAIILLK